MNIEDGVSAGNNKAKSTPSRSGGAGLVALGIALSRIMGLVRQKIFAFYFGNSDVGDAFYAALKIPNFLQNLLGDGVLSASFIPVYSQLRAQGKSDEADRMAGMIGALLAIVTTAIVAVGVLTTPLLIDLIAPGFEGEKRELTILLVQIFFPGTGFLVLSAWCLGILNSHRKFFLSYAAPVIWNITIIAALVFFGSDYFGQKVDQTRLVVLTSWAVLVGSLLQFLIQIPVVLKCAPRLKWNLKNSGSAQQVLKSFTPVVTSRGVVQFSAYVDNIIASLLPTGAVSALAYAQSLYMLPISIFGMSVSAAELPTMSEAIGTREEISQKLRMRLLAGLRQIAFFVIPSVVGFWLVGDVIVRALYKGGEFGETGVSWVWGVLVGYSIGLLSSTWGRLFSSAFYALKDTKTPLKFALLRVLLSMVLGYIAGLHLPAWLGLEEQWGTVGLTASAGMTGWIEFMLLRRALFAAIGKVQFPKFFLVKIWFSALLAGAVVFFLKSWMSHSILLNLVLVLGVFGILYFPLTSLFGIEESQRFTKRIFKRS